MKSSHFRFLLLALLGTSALWPQAPVRGQDVLEGLAGVVNDKPITFSEVRELIAPKEKHARATLQGTALVESIQQIRLSAINDLIDRSLILQEFTAKGFTVPAYVIDEREKEVIRDSFGGDRQAFLRTLNAQGMTPDKFREFQRDMIAVQEMRRQATKGVTTITEAQAKEYYTAHEADYRIPEAVKLRMIALRTEPGEPSKRDLLEQIRLKITAGAAFADLAGAYGSDEEARKSQGDLGWVDRQQLNETLTKAAFALKPGEVSSVIELEGSYYLLQSEGQRPAAMKSLEEVSPEIEKALLQIERQKQLQEWLLKLRKKAFIKIY